MNGGGASQIGSTRGRRHGPSSALHVGAPGAIVLGADYRGLGVVRSLGRKGVRVWVLTQPEERLAGSSRYAERALRRPRQLVPFLLGLPDVDGWALFPTTDEDAALLGRNHDVLSERFAV